MNFNAQDGFWINPPREYAVTRNSLEIITEPGTDFWQRTYYGFRNENAPAFLFSSRENFTFTCKAAFAYTGRFDQCGPVIFFDNRNWFKASIEYENEEFSRLGSVVTNYGYSDWATTDMQTPDCIYYRLSRRGPDFLIEQSRDGKTFAQMRIFHMHAAGESTDDVCYENRLDGVQNEIHFGLYACSPGELSFKAVFSDMVLEQCKWSPHK